MPVQIPKHYKETSISKPNAIGEGIAGSAKTATNYITDINNSGITVHPVGGTTSRLQVNANGTTVYQNNTDVAFYGATSRIGKSNGDRVVVDSTNGITIYKANSKRLQTSADGINVFSDGTTSVAKFGEETRIGAASGKHVDFDYDGITMYAGNGTSKVVQIYHTADTTSSDYNYNAGIEFCNGRGEILMVPSDDRQWELTVKSGAPDSTRGASASLEAQRRWSSDANKQDYAYVQLDTFSSGTSPRAMIACSSGDRGAYIDLTSTGSATGDKVEIDSYECNVISTRFKLDGVDCFITRGFVGQTNTAPANGYVDVPITFGHTYSAAPIVVAGLLSTSNSAGIGYISAAVLARTTTGATVRLFNAGTSDRTPGFYWIAVG